MGDLEMVDLDMVDMRVVDMGVIVAGVVELMVGVVGKDCLREVELLDEDYLMKMEMVAEGCLLDDLTRFGAYHQLGFDH